MADLSVEQIQFEQALANLLDQFGVGDISGDTGSGTILSERLSLINMVKAKLDEIIPEGEGVQISVEGSPNISDPLDLLINAILDEAAKRVLLNCPLHYLDPVKSSENAGTANTNDDKIGHIKLASNFLRFVSLKMADWERIVYSVMRPEEQPNEYAIQQNKFTRGKTAKPVAAFSHRTINGNQERVIEYYSVDSSHNIDWLYYVQETSAQNIQSNLIDSLTWYAAGMILQITERVDLAKVAFEQEQLCYQNL